MSSCLCKPGDVITNQESETLAKVARIALAKITARRQHAVPSNLLKNGERGRNRTFNLLIKS
jgi:hypothetical protein